MIDKIVFEGGGVLGISYAGVIKRLNETNLLNNVDTFMGTSVGAIVATFMAIGEGRFNTVSDLIKDFDYSIIKKGNTLVNSHRLYKKYGFYSTHQLGQTLCEKLEYLGVEPDITFQGLYDYFKKDVLITVTNVTKKKVEVWSRHNKPNMSVVQAMIVSASIPLFFEPYVDKESGDTYCDGGLIRNYNIQYFKNEDLNSIMGFIIRTKKECQIESNIKSIASYSETVFELLYNTANFAYIEGRLWDRTTQVKVDNISPIGFDVSDKDRESLYQSGLNINLEKFGV